MENGYGADMSPYTIRNGMTVAVDPLRLIESIRHMNGYASSDGDLWLGTALLDLENEIKRLQAQAAEVAEALDDEVRHGLRVPVEGVDVARSVPVLHLADLRDLLRDQR